MGREIYLFEDWDAEETTVTWQKRCRDKLNGIIQTVNDWQIAGFPDGHPMDVVLARIDLGIRTIGERDGGSGYREYLEKMRRFVVEGEVG